MALPPTYTNFVAPAIDAGNLNAINLVIYQLMGNGVDPPINDSDIRTNIGLGTMATQDANNVNITGGTISGATLPNQPGRLIGTQTFTANGTYTPTAGTTSIIVEGLGAGGGGGGCAATGAGQVSTSGGGGAGAVGKTRLTSGFSGTAVTIGTGGAGVLGAAGATGSVTSFGAYLILNGGQGGQPGTPGSQSAGLGGIGGVSTGGTVYNGTGGRGETATGSFLTLVMLSGWGANSPYGGGGGAAVANNGIQALGGASTGFGAGGGGAASGASQPAIGGAAGSGGLIIVYEYA